MPFLLPLNQQSLRQISLSLFPWLRSRHRPNSFTPSVSIYTNPATPSCEHGRCSATSITTRYTMIFTPRATCCSCHICKKRSILWMLAHRSSITARLCSLDFAHSDLVSSKRLSRHCKTFLLLSG